MRPTPPPKRPSRPPSPPRILRRRRSVLSLSAGATSGNSATLTYTSLGGFSGVITQACSITYSGGAAIDLPSCSFATSTVSLNSGSTVTSTITIASTAPSGSGGSAHAGLHNGSSNSSAALASLTIGSIVFLLWSGRARKSQLQGLLGILVIGVALLSITACGKSNSSTPPPTGSSTGTYTISLTSASAGTTATPPATITLTLH